VSPEPYGAISQKITIIAFKHKHYVRIRLIHGASWVPMILGNFAAGSEAFAIAGLVRVVAVPPHDLFHKLIGSTLGHTQYTD